ncbi:MAG: methyltransferase [Marmoricola sp.]|nr:methyltransferase [Marmoricola sp.]
MTHGLDPVAHNRAAWDRLVAEQDVWTRPVSPAEVERARAGEWSIVLVGHEPVDRSWFPDDLGGVDVLCLAGAGGQQGPILAAAGANVTVLDNSPAQLGQDELVAARDGLSIRTVLGDMRDLGAFADGSFDLVVNPVSNVFCPDLHPVWRECHRVLRPGGELLVGFMNPDLFVFDHEPMEERGELVVRHPLPFSDLDDLSEEERARMFGADAAVEYSHTMADQVGGQLAAGFVLTGFTEAPHQDSPTSRFMPGYFATRAVRRPGPAPRG